MTHFTLGQLARKTGLARSSLLHYEATGLLMPAGRSASGYRLYGAAEVARLDAIRAYRAAGLPLAAIRTLLAKDADRPARILEQHLRDLSDDIARLQARRRTLATLLAQPDFRDDRSPRSKAEWVGLLRRSGLDDDGMRQWHAAFDADDPSAHAAFLRSLGLRDDEIDDIRRWSSGRRRAEKNQRLDAVSPRIPRRPG
jgi:DNA-binding transcriptional MerR regulator